MTVTMIGPTGPRVGGGVARPGLRAVWRSIDRHHVVPVQCGSRVRPPGVGGNCSHRGWARDAMRMSRRTPNLPGATP